jgi:STE24 endopeptidase
LGVAGSALSAAVLVLAVASQAGARIPGALGIGDWRLQVIVVGTALIVAGALVRLPLGLWSELVHERRWGFGRQTLRGVLADRAKGIVIGALIANIALLGLWWLLRSTRWWWLLGWLGMTSLSLLLTFAAPVVLAPLFNRFRPLEDDELRREALSLGEATGVPIRDVLVMDASRRTGKHNAYFTGIGRTKRVVLWDTLVRDFDRDSIRLVLAHELSHWRRRHVLLGAAGTGAGSLAAFVVLRWLLAQPAVLELAGAAGRGDPALIPVVLLAFTVLGTFTGPLQQWVSRAWERQADLDAMSMTNDPITFVRMERELALKNRSEISPSRLAYLLSSHPPPEERIALAKQWEAGRAVPQPR